ncbi:MAG: MFS transporter [Alicyclobacillus herbarius]|uniref:MFS transporter n=1 Tax=Alicyclobacillus herbarius TaxID=122960 RepID=UPI002353A362|nr:MFS transporter [Alicyclobacillus herbarius]MCL6630995.1 MFS transporter [Alicyclobacillus herbarius]
MSDVTVSVTSSEERRPSAARLLSVSGIGLLFDSMDNALLSFVLTSIAAQWHLNPSLMGILGSISFIGMAIGSAFAGSLADRFGRRTIFMWTLLIYSLATGLTAFAGGLAIFIILRFLVGLGLGGELPVATTYVLESSPEAVRGRRVVLLESFWAGGALLAALISFFVVPWTSWRIVFLIGAVPALFTLIVRQTLPETPKFKALPRKSIRHSMATLWRPGILRGTLVTWVLWFVMNFAYYGMSVWLPSVMTMKGYNLVHSIGYVLIMTIAQIPGYLTAAWLVEKWGRKRILVPAMLCTALAALGFGHAPSTVWLIIFGLCLNYFMLAAFAGTYIFTVEQFPTFARASGIGWAAGFGRIGGIVAPFLVGALLGSGVSITAVFTIFFATVIVGFAVVLIFGRETLGRQIDDPLHDQP